MSDEKAQRYALQAIADVSSRWSISPEDAEAFLSEHDYFAAIRGGIIE